MERAQCIIIKVKSNFGVGKYCTDSDAETIKRNRLLYRDSFCEMMLGACFTASNEVWGCTLYRSFIAGARYLRASWISRDIRIQASHRKSRADFSIEL